METLPPTDPAAGTAPQPPAAGEVRDQFGRTVEELSRDRPLLLVFLRDFG